MKRFSLIMILIAIIAAAAHAAPEGPVPPARFDALEARPGTVELVVHAAGMLAPKDRTVVPAPISGKVEWVIDEGTSVARGTEVARIDCTEYLDNLEQNKLDLGVAQAEFRRAKAEDRWVRERLEFDVKRCELALERARLLRAALGAPTDVNVELSRLTAEQTRFAMEAAAREHERMKSLGEKGIESGQAVALARLKYERARVDHLKARADDELLLKGTPVEDIAVADQEVKRAETALDLAAKRLVRQAAWQATQVRVAEVGVERVQAMLALQQERIDRSRVAAPVDGVVIYPRQWGVALRAGDPVWRSNRLLDVADLSDMTVEAVISQADWSRVKPGQPVEVRLTAFPRQTFRGVVRTVGRIARDRSLILSEEVSNVMSVQVVVDVLDHAQELRPSYTAAVAIAVGRCENCIAVPRSAVVASSAGDAVWVREAGGRLRLRPVTLGPSDAVQAVVDKGLAAGDIVIVPRDSAKERP